MRTITSVGNLLLVATGEKIVKRILLFSLLVGMMTASTGRVAAKATRLVITDESGSAQRGK